MQAAEELRPAAREIFHHALAEASLEKAFTRHLSYDRGVLRVRDDLYHLQSYGRVFVASFGKAGHRMAELLARLAGNTVEGIISDPAPPSHQLQGYRYFAGGHPFPNAESVRAADAVLKSLAALHPQSLVLFMISGGGSAVMERPVDPEISLSDLISTYEALVYSGAPIAQINALRKHLSAVKGGRMALAAQAAQQVSVLVSDVPDNALDALASGPTMPDPSTAADCYRIAAEYNMLQSFPPSVRELFERHALEETPKQGDPAFTRSRWWKVLSNEEATKAAAEKAAQLGFTVTVDHSCDDWDYARAADYLFDRLRTLRQKSNSVCIVSGGEVTVKITGKAGSGGRNQQFALYCAQKISGDNLAVLSCGTDGIDGNSLAAGGVVDGTTVERAQALGLDVDQHLRSFNASPLLEKLGDTIHTGPTGNNIRDVRILLAL